MQAIAGQIFGKATPDHVVKCSAEVALGEAADARGILLPQAGIAIVLMNVPESGLHLVAAHGGRALFPLPQQARQQQR